MADRYGSRGPAHWNSYRPSYSPRKRHRDRTRSPARRSVSPRRSKEVLDNGKLRARKIAARRRRERNIDRGVTRSEVKELPKLWDDDLEQLMGRTLRAYDLVIDYDRDSEGGTRWSDKDIADIYDIGKHLHGDRQNLTEWQRKVARAGKPTNTMLRDIRDDANDMRILCLRVQLSIRQRERHVKPMIKPVVKSSPGTLSDREVSIPRREDTSPRRRCQRSRSPSPEPKASPPAKKRRVLEVKKDGCGGRGREQPRQLAIVGRLGKHIMHR